VTATNRGGGRSGRPSTIQTGEEKEVNNKGARGKNILAIENSGESRSGETVRGVSKPRRTFVLGRPQTGASASKCEKGATSRERKDSFQCRATHTLRERNHLVPN